MLVVTNGACVGAQEANALTETQILTMKSQAEADLAELLKRVQSSTISEAESQKLIAAQVQQLADVQLALDQKTAALLAERNREVDTDLSDKLKAEITKVASLQGELARSKSELEQKDKNHQESLADLFKQRTDLEILATTETQLRLKTAKLLNEKLIEIAELTKKQGNGSRDEIQSLLASISALRVNLKNSRNQSESLKADLAKVQSQHKNLVIKTKVLNKEVKDLASKLKEATQKIEILEGKLAKAVSTQNWLSAQLRKNRQSDASDSREAQPALMALKTDVLFKSGSTRLSKLGKLKVRELIPELETVVGKMPKSSDWVLVIEGHADATPIRRSRYKTNLALSIARALTVVREITLHSKIEPKRLMAAGFGEFRPLQTGFAPEALAANRRVELRLIQR